MQAWAKSVGATRSFQGREYPEDVFVFLESESIANQLLDDPEFIAAVENGFVEISFNGIDEIATPEKALAFLGGHENFKSSWAVDKDNVDQVITSDGATLIEAERIIWDIIGDYDLSQSKFYPPIDGIWNMNGTVAIKESVNVAKVSIQIWRNDELWFTVAQRVSNLDYAFIPFTCDVDAYKSEDHNFDLRIALEKIDAGLPISCTVSGSDEETSYGMSFLHQLDTPSPT